MWGEAWGVEQCEGCKAETPHHIQEVERRDCGCIDNAWVACDVCGNGFYMEYEGCDCPENYYEDDDMIAYGPTVYFDLEDDGDESLGGV